MVDNLERIFQTLERQLPIEEDRELLRKLIEIQRKEGPDAVTKYLERTIEEVAGD